MAPETCPNCGAFVPEDAVACPECGADENTGWNDRATAQRLDLPDDEFDHDEFIASEFGSKDPGPLKVAGISWRVWATALLLALLLLRRFF